MSSDEEFHRNSLRANVLKNGSPGDIPVGLWLWIVKFRDNLHDFRHKPTNFRYRLVLRAVQGDPMSSWRCRCQKVQKSIDITINRLEKNKDTNTYLSENDNTTIENTFWSTEISFWPISVNEGSLRVSNAVLVCLHRSQTEYEVKKPCSSSVSCLKTDREHSFLSYHKGPQRQKYV